MPQEATDCVVGASGDVEICFCVLVMTGFNPGNLTENITWRRTVIL